MIIDCPSCATRYDVSDDCLGAEGRALQCVVCDHNWYLPAPEPISKYVRSRHQRADSRHDAPVETKPRAEAPLQQAPASPPPPQRAASETTPPASSSTASIDTVELNTGSFGAQEAPRQNSGERLFSKAKKLNRDQAQDEEEALKQAFATRAAKNKAKPKKGFVDAMREIDEKPAPQTLAFGSDTTADDAEAESDDEQLFMKPAPERIVDAEFVDLERKADAEHAAEKAEQSDAVNEDETDDDDDKSERGFRTLFGRRDAQDDDDDDEQDDDEADVQEAGQSLTASRALTSLDPLDQAAERIFNEEFFRALRVQPKELERALRKARRRAEAREKNRMTPWRAFGWLLWISVVGTTAIALLHHRDKIIEAIPESALAYQAVGIDVNAPQITIAKVDHRLAMSTLGPSIEVTGRLSNNGNRAASTPLLQAEAISQEGDVIARWTFKAVHPQIAPDQTVEFISRAHAPQGIAEIIVSFAPENPLPRIGPGSEEPELAEDAPALQVLQIETSIR